MNGERLQGIAALFRRQGLVELEVEMAGERLALVAGRGQGDMAPVQTPAALPAALVLRSPGMGLLRLCHPQRAQAEVAAGAVVIPGQVVAWLENDGLLEEIRAVEAGVVGQVLTGDGQRVGYADALFEYR
ncbi:biotin/lipoyl-containing protein [Pseudomonas japonica]|uniref:Acetyl-CoA carboxylase biotin carboxyl carrier protein n=1 Tax=Pseudomonas japonica TaxID=256466 RepID=A0A239LCT8_9PSED|nr:biotin/lipoyl-containing protein [Pseudomonas japonica]SNT27772.1 acetyl-CoA carboxylase biotin carboxyl carrier protein [Pseudomonas japonica]